MKPYEKLGMFWLWNLMENRDVLTMQPYEKKGCSDSETTLCKIGIFMDILILPAYETLWKMVIFSLYGCFQKSG